MTALCCNLAGGTTVTAPFDGLIVGDHVQTSDVTLTGGVAYFRGDLLTHTPATNTVVPAAAGTIGAAVFIMPFTLTAAEATAHVATGFGLQVYSQGEYAQDRVSLSGVVLTPAQIPAAKGALNARNIELRRVI